MLSATFVAHVAPHIDNFRRTQPGGWRSAGEQACTQRRTDIPDDAVRVAVDIVGVEDEYFPARQPHGGTTAIVCAALGPVPGAVVLADDLLVGIGEIGSADEGAVVPAKDVVLRDRSRESTVDKHEA